MIFSAKKSPRAYLTLIDQGAAPNQIPPWMTRPAPPAARPVVLPGAPIEPQETPPVQPIPPGETVEPLFLEAKDQVPPGALRAPSVGAFEAYQGAGAGARLGGIYDGARERDARLQAMGIVRTDDGRYLQAATQPDGSPGFVVVDPIEVEQGIRQDVGAQISEAAVGQLNIHMRTVMRKVG